MEEQELTEFCTHPSRLVSRTVGLGGGYAEIERSGILNNCGNNTIYVQELTKLNKETGAILYYCSNRCIS
jgi:hypothetical protein